MFTERCTRCSIRGRIGRYLATSYGSRESNYNHSFFGISQTCPSLDGCIDLGRGLLVVGYM